MGQAWVRYRPAVVLAVGGANAVAFMLKQLGKGTSMTQALNRRGRAIY